MKVSQLREALQLIKPVIPGKPTLPIIKNALLDDGKVMGTDLETAVVVALPEVDTRCLLPHHEVLELLKYVPGNELLTIELEEKLVKLNWESGNASYTIPDSLEYPELPVLDPKIAGGIDGDTLIKGLVAMVPYCCSESGETSRPVLTGVHTYFEEKTTTVVGADGFRLAYQILPIALSGERTVIIPAGSIGIVRDLWKASPGSVDAGDDLISQIIGHRMMYLSIDDNFIAAKFGNITITIRLIQGTPPNYKELIPKDYPMSVKFFSTDLERSLQGAKMLSKENASIVRLMWTDNSMTVLAKSESIGEIKTQIIVKAEGGEGKVGINIGYLLSYLKGKDGLVTMIAKDPGSPVRFDYNNAPTVIMMPKKVEWVGEVKKAEEEAQASGDDEVEEDGDNAQGGESEEEEVAEDKVPAKAGKGKRK